MSTQRTNKGKKRALPEVGFYNGHPISIMQDTEPHSGSGRRKRLTEFRPPLLSDQMARNPGSCAQLYETRDGVDGFDGDGCRKGRGLFATANIQKGQIIMLEEPLMTLYYFEEKLRQVSVLGTVRVVSLGSALPPCRKTLEIPRNVSDPQTPAARENPQEDHEVEQAMRRLSMDERGETAKVDLDDVTMEFHDMKLTAQEQERASYREGNDAFTQVRKRLLAAYNYISESSPERVDAMKRLHHDEKDQYGGDWLHGMWQRYSYEIPLVYIPDSTLLEPHVENLENLTLDHCCALYPSFCYANHSCLPNTDVIFRREEHGRVWLELFATEDILRNDELTFGYIEWDRLRRRGISAIQAMDMSGSKCYCEPCLKGYNNQIAWATRD
ncbi:uncharacterized protein RCO7_04646 [Rhynchosporium graminicola]|uniref:SET domain-containing protein n=1 Tax=Rhynchosporium graminicola TaxID=2792576 RepID=A0A1E1JTI2_9HELO|nr:uncharacterized protein RCO7_04646 [Rhynchosporium commune]